MHHSLQRLYNCVVKSARFAFHAGREMPGAPEYRRRDTVDFKGLKSHIKRYNRELGYYVKVSALFTSTNLSNLAGYVLICAACCSAVCCNLIVKV